MRATSSAPRKFSGSGKSASHPCMYDCTVCGWRIASRNGPPRDRLQRGMDAERREVLLYRFRQHQQRLIGAQPYFKIEAVRKMRFFEQRARLRRIVIVAFQIQRRSRAGSVA